MKQADHEDLALVKCADHEDPTKAKHADTSADSTCPSFSVALNLDISPGKTLRRNNIFGGLHRHIANEEHLLDLSTSSQTHLTCEVTSAMLKISEWLGF